MAEFDEQLGGIGNPDQQGGLGGPARPEQNNAENVRRRQEAAIDRLPVGAERIINLVQSAEIGEGGDVKELQRAIDTALAYREGLTMGVSGIAYEFDPAAERGTPEYSRDMPKVGNLQRMFTTVEGSINRPQTAVAYIDAAIDNALDARVQRAQDFHDVYTRNPEEWNAAERLRLETLNEIYKRQGKDYEHLILNTEQIATRISDETARFSREFEAIPKLVELRGFVDSRSVLDDAFMLRMRTCESPENAGELGQKIYCPTPDALHWMSLFQGEVTGEYGKGTAAVFEEIMKLGLPESVVTRVGMTPIPAEIRNQVRESIYAKGFESARGFGTWLKHLQEKANGRMDVVWGAWKLALTWESVDTLGQTTDKGKHVLAAPPLGNSLMTFVNHLPEKRMIEYGLKANGDRATVEKYIGHSGLPLSIEYIPDLCSDFLRESKIKFDKRGLEGLGEGFVARFLENLPRRERVGTDGVARKDDDYEDTVTGTGKKYDKLKEKIEKLINETRNADGDIEVKDVEISLWDLWLYGRIGLSDPRFPWYGTDQPSAESTPGELPPGSFGQWLLTRSRASKVLADIKLTPDFGGQNGLGGGEFFTSRIRNWGKVLGTIKADVKPGDDDYIKPEENPAAWWVAGLINLHITFREAAGIKLSKPKIEESADYHYSSAGQNWSFKAKGKEEKGAAITDFLYNAVACGFLRPEDVSWIKETLGINTIPLIVS